MSFCLTRVEVGLSLTINNLMTIIFIRILQYNVSVNYKLNGCCVNDNSNMLLKRSLCTALNDNLMLTLCYFVITTRNKTL